MLGAIIGDMVGSIYEFDPIKSKEFDIFNKRMHMTDDSYLTLAVAKVLMNHHPINYSKESLEDIKKDLIKEFALTYKKYPHAGWGTNFSYWCREACLKGTAKPYNSCGNGSAMRISPVGWIANSETEVKLLSKAVSEISHNHPEGIKGAEAVALSIYLARIGKTKEEIKRRITCDYYPEIESFNFNDLVKHYEFSELCQESVPQAIYCFLISDSLEDTIRNCVAIGGDCDTTGAIAGSIAEAYYQKSSISELERKYLNERIDSESLDIIARFYKLVNNKMYNKNK